MPSSASSLQIPPDVLDLLRAFSAHEVRFLIVGAHALGYSAQPRATGDLDLFVGGRVVPGRYPESPISRLYRNEGNRLVDVTEAAIPSLRLGGLVTGALWSDYDDDGRLDLFVTALDRRYGYDFSGYSRASLTR